VPTEGADDAEDWRDRHAKVGCDELVAPNAVLKWSRQLMAAFGRVNRNAGKKCVPGVLAEQKPLRI
jgi:hypothetical protein